MYNNVESAELLMPYWPETSRGSVIITTRDPSLTSESATSGLEMTAWGGETGSEFLLFLLNRSIGNDIQAEGDTATELSRKLDGHALTISYLAGLIRHRSWSIADFMRVYSEIPTTAHQSELQAIWNLSFAALDKDSRTFLGIVAFLSPETIPQSLFELRQDLNTPQHLRFCTNDLRYDR